MVERHAGLKLGREAVAEQARNEPEPAPLHVRQLRRKHLVHRLLPQQPTLALLVGQPQQRLQQPRVVRRRRVQPGPAALDLDLDGPGLLLAARELARLGIAMGRRNDNNNLVLFLFWRSKETRVAHAQRRKHGVRHVRAERLARDPLDDVARPVEAGAVVPALAGGELERRVPGLDGAAERVFVGPGDVLGPPGEVRVCVGVAEAGGVGE